MGRQDWQQRQATRQQMNVTHPREWARPWPSRWLDGLRGTERQPAQKRFVVGLAGVGWLLAGWLMWGMGIGMMGATRDETVRVTGVGLVVLGLIITVVVWLARPIAKVTFRAWLAARWNARHMRRHAANASGYASARAKRSVTNKSAWAAQRQRSGRAARPEYGSSLRGRIVAPWGSRSTT